MTLVEKTFSLPAEALFQALLDTGHVHSKAEFAKLAGISVGNVYNYLPSGRGTRKTQPFRATMDTIRKWLAALRRSTGLRIELIESNEGDLSFKIDGITASGQELSPPVVYKVLRDAEAPQP